MGGSQGYSWGDGRGQEEKRGSWGTRGPNSGGGVFKADSSRVSGRGSNTWQESQNVAKPLRRSNVADGGWRKIDGVEHPRAHSDSQQWEHGGPQEYRYSGPDSPTGGSPAVGVGVGAAVVSTKASTMHNPVDPEELARIQAKKDAYRRDLETQVIEAASVRAKKIRSWSIVVKGLTALETTQSNFQPYQFPRSS